MGQTTMVNLNIIVGKLNLSKKNLFVRKNFINYKQKNLICKQRNFNFTARYRIIKLNEAGCFTLASD